MAKPKLTDGMLCRDKARNEITFFAKARRKDLIFTGDYWCMTRIFDWKIWTLKSWKAAHDLAPPKPGECFPVSIEL